MDYVSKAEGGGWDNAVLRQALEGAKQALLDEDTHLGKWSPYHDDFPNAAFQWSDLPLLNDCAYWKEG